MTTLPHRVAAAPNATHGHAHREADNGINSCTADTHSSAPVRRRQYGA